MTSSPQHNAREARVSEAGVGLFLTPAELRALGVDLDEVTRVSYVIQNGAIRIVSPVTDKGD